MSRRNLVLLLVGTLLLSACGFRLRGTTSDDAFRLQEINLASRDAYSDTLRQLKVLLESNHVQITPLARYTFDILDEQTYRRPSSYTSSGRVAEYALTTSLTYAILDRNGLQVMQDSIQARKLQSYDENNVIGSYQESSLLGTEMRHDLVQRLIERLQRITPEQLDKLQAKAQAADAEALARKQQPPQQSPAGPAEEPASAP